MSESPLLKRARARLAQQRQQAQKQWQIKPGENRKAMLRWAFRFAAIIVLLLLVLYRFGGGRM